jgi:hypothetical protein
VLGDEFMGGGVFGVMVKMDGYLVASGILGKLGSIPRLKVWGESCLGPRTMKSRGSFITTWSLIVNIGTIGLLMAGMVIRDWIVGIPGLIMKGIATLNSRSERRLWGESVLGSWTAVTRRNFVIGPRQRSSVEGRLLGESVLRFWTVVIHGNFIVGRGKETIPVGL